MKKLMLAVALVVISAVALALPKPAQIEDALAAGKYADARGMVKEVLRERPASARAHLLNAYLLAHVDRDGKAASAELNTAVGLDTKGDVKASPLFGRVVAEIEALPVAKAAPSASAPKGNAWRQADGTLSFLSVLLIAFLVAFLLLGIIGFVLSLRRERAPIIVSGRSNDGPHAWYRPASPPDSPAPGGNYFGGYGAMAHGAPTTSAQREPMGAMATAASVAGGVVAGNMISDVIRNHSYDSAAHSRRDDDFGGRSSRVRDDSPAPASAPDLSYETTRSSFSSGSGDSDWGGSGGGGGSDFGSGSSDSGSSGDW